MNLALEQQRVQNLAGIVAGNVTQVLDLASFGIYLDHGHMRTKWEGSSCGLEKRCVGQPAVWLGSQRQFRPGLGNGRGAGHMKCASVLIERDVSLVCFQQPSRQSLGFVDQFAGGVEHRCATLLQRPRAHGAGSLRHQIGVAPYDINHVHRDTGLLVRQHAPRGDVALAMGRCAGVDHRPPTW